MLGVQSTVSSTWIKLLAPGLGWPATEGSHVRCRPRTVTIALSIRLPATGDPPKPSTSTSSGSTTTTSHIPCTPTLTTSIFTLFKKGVLYPSDDSTSCLDPGLIHINRSIPVVQLTNTGRASEHHFPVPLWWSSASGRARSSQTLLSYQRTGPVPVVVCRLSTKLAALSLPLGMCHPSITLNSQSPYSFISQAILLPRRLFQVR